jgi:hypothetical protein
LYKDVGDGLNLHICLGGMNKRGKKERNRWREKRRGRIEKEVENEWCAL